MSVKLSIIVPVYKVEKYLRRCLDSIKSQIFTDFECILVDDGSPDSSGKICDEYAKKDTRFHVIHKANGGVSSARNAGLDAANGEWIGFVDADDWIDSHLYKEVFELAQDNNADLVQYNMDFFSGTRNWKNAETKKSGNFNILNSPTYFEPSMWAKVFKKTFAHNLRFPENIALSEDRLFSLQVYLACKNCFYTDKIFYHYFARENSASHSINKNMVLQEEKVIKNMEALCSKYSSELDDFIFEQKKIVKNHIIYFMKEFDGKMFRNVFPEINKKLLKAKTKVVLIYFLLYIHADWLAYFLLVLFHKRIN